MNYEDKYQDMVNTINCLYEYLEEEEKKTKEKTLKNFIHGELYILKTLKDRI